MNNGFCQILLQNFCKLNISIQLYLAQLNQNPDDHKINRVLISVEMLKVTSPTPIAIGGTWI